MCNRPSIAAAVALVSAGKGSAILCMQICEPKSSDLRFSKSNVCV